MPFTKLAAHGGIRDGRISAIGYGASHNENIRFSKDIQFRIISLGIASAKLNGIIGFWTFSLF
jgi:hypothetical protein